MSPEKSSVGKNGPVVGCLVVPLIDFYEVWYGDR